MKERPILMSAPMVRAILDGTKTQTRRQIVSHKKAAPNFVIYETPSGFWPTYSEDGERGFYTDSMGYDIEERLPCPYGQPCDLLWVRETWKYTDWTDDGYPFLKYRADGKILLRDDLPSEQSSRVIDIWANLSEPENYDIDGLAADRRWRSSIHMPRWASRITLEVTRVRAERLQSISPEDALAEGITHNTLNDPRVEYQRLWEDINGPDSWSANPWVWVINFRRLKP